MSNMNHPFHLVEKSPWPLIASVNALFLVAGLVKWFHELTPNLLYFGLLGTILTSAQWWRDVAREGSLQGLHTLKVANGLRWGMALFIVSEVLFFFSFFWAFFHSSLTADPSLGGVWPPTDIVPFNTLHIPLLNTAILLASGVSVTWAHHAIISKNFAAATQAMALTVTLGLYFTGLQAMEYLESSFSISDSVYGATFFVMTGFHGLHVIIGSLFLTVSLARMMLAHFSSKHHFGLEAAIWYWHFVDVVWLFLYTAIYCWGA